MTKELVIATYDREYDWVNKINSDVKITVYTKNLYTKNKKEIIIDKNVGRDVHTFFYHIVKNYDNLTDYTFFSQDNHKDHVENYVEIINGNIDTWDSNAKQHFEECWFYRYTPIEYPFWTWHISTQFGGKVLKCDQQGIPDHGGLKMVETWDQLFITPCPNEIEFVPGGHFSISKKQFHIRPKYFYEKILSILETCYMSPWIFERLLPYIFNSTINII